MIAQSAHIASLSLTVLFVSGLGGYAIWAL
jgi:hypothetical protein